MLSDAAKRCSPDILMPPGLFEPPCQRLKAVDVVIIIFGVYFYMLALLPLFRWSRHSASPLLFAYASVIFIAVCLSFLLISML